MKLAEFNELCDREWRRSRADILELRLTDDSRKQLAADSGFCHGDDIDAVVNPVTRTIATVTSSPWDCVIVMMPAGGGGDAE